MHNIDMNHIMERLEEFGERKRVLGYCNAIHYYLLSITTGYGRGDRYVPMAELLVDIPMFMPNNLKDFNEDLFWRKAIDYKVADLIWIPFGMAVIEDKVREGLENKRSGELH